MENEIIDLINRYWKFDDNQHPVSTWHDKQDLMEAVQKVLSKEGNLNCDHEWKCEKFDIYGFPMEQYCEKCGRVEEL